MKEPSSTTIFTPEDLPADAHLMAQTMETFLTREVLPVQTRLEAHEGGLLRGLVKQAGDLGLLAGGLPNPYGLGLPKTTLALLAERSAINLSLAVTIGVHAGVAALPLLFFGTNDQKERYLPRIATGEIVAAFALTESNAGSDARSLEVRATLAPDKNHYLLDGVKLWVTNAGIADLFTVFTQIEGVGMAAFLVDRTIPGVAVGPEEYKLGLRGASTCRLMLNQASIPKTDILGDPGEGHRPALYALNPGRFQIGAIALGGAKEALRLAASHAGHRRQSGHEIAHFGLIQEKLASMAVPIFLLESMVYRTAGDWDLRSSDGEGSIDTLAAAAEEYAIECSLIKFFGSEVMGFAVDEALQIHGGYGFSEDYPIARLYRDARVFRIFEGTNEINRLSIFGQLSRRVERGRLPFNSALALQATSQEWPKTDDPLQAAGYVVAQVRRIALVALVKMKQKSVEQEAAAAIADLCSILYGLESGWLRAIKYTRRFGGRKNAALICALQIATEKASARVVELARLVLAACGASAMEASEILAPFNSRPLVSLPRLNRAVTQSVIEHGGYFL